MCVEIFGRIYGSNIWSYLPFKNKKFWGHSRKTGMMYQCLFLDMWSMQYHMNTTLQCSITLMQYHINAGLHAVSHLCRIACSITLMQDCMQYHINATLRCRIPCCITWMQCHINAVSHECRIACSTSLLKQRGVFSKERLVHIYSFGQYFIFHPQGTVSQSFTDVCVSPQA